jgi:pilus assembly protein Flp/PilA
MLYLPREEGQGLVEYALILVLIAIVVIVILTTLGGVINDVFGDVVAGLGG